MSPHLLGVDQGYVKGMCSTCRTCMAGVYKVLHTRTLTEASFAVLSVQQLCMKSKVYIMTTMQ